MNAKSLTRIRLPFQKRLFLSTSHFGSTLSPSDVQIKSKFASQKSNGKNHMSLEELPSLSSMTDTARCELAYGLAQTDAASFSKLRLTDLQKEQLKSCDAKNNSVTSYEKVNLIDSDPLPRTFEDALRPTRRALVVTEANAPYRVVNVNNAWVDLCGYSYVESKGKTLGNLLQGPKTDASATTAMMHQLLHGEEVGITLINYTKDGREFRNRLRAGPLLEGDRVTHFVGVLQEVAS